VSTLCGLDADQTWNLLPEEISNLRSPKSSTQDCFTSTINAVDLEHILCDVQPNYSHLDGHGTLLPRR